jgi:acyl transferase domain-containing protein
MLVFSGNNEKALHAYVAAPKQHFMDQRVRVRVRDLAFTLSEKHSWLLRRGFVVSSRADFDNAALGLGAICSGAAPRASFIFIGQGAQWPQMGNELVETFSSGAHHGQAAGRGSANASDTTVVVANG